MRKSEIFSQTFKIKATDIGGLEVISPLFKTKFIPRAEETILTLGENRDNLLANNLGNIINKNTLINLDLDSVLNINAPELKDKEGDQLFLNLRVKSSSSEIYFNSKTENSFVSTKSDGTTVTHTIDLNNYQELKIIASSPNINNKLMDKISNF